MDNLKTEALSFISRRWGYILEGAAGADLIGVNRATMRTRIAKGQAMAMRDTEGRERGRVEYTPGHLVYNMLYEGLARYNALPDQEEARDFIFHVAEQIRRDIQSGTFSENLVIRSMKRGSQVSLKQYSSFSDDVEKYTGEPAVVVPIGVMVTRLAYALFSRHDPEGHRKALSH